MTVDVLFYSYKQSPDYKLLEYQIFIVFKCLPTLPLALNKHQSLLSLSKAVQENPLHP